MQNTHKLMKIIDFLSLKLKLIVDHTLRIELFRFYPLFTIKVLKELYDSRNRSHSLL